VTLAAAGVVALVAIEARGRQPGPVHLVVSPMTVREITPDPAALRVCADPNNLPFSNQRGEGFENAIANLVARDLHKRLASYWLPQRRGFVRNSLRVGVCDAIIGVPAGYELVRTTRPYYRSTYVFVSRPGHIVPASLDDRALRRLTIGIQITGDDYDNPPAAAALAARHLSANVRGYSVYGDYSQASPLQRVVDDVRRGRIGTAVVWGPTAGYFARTATPPLRITPVTPERDPVAGPFAFDIAMGVRTDDRALADALNGVIIRRQAEIERILQSFGVPLMTPGALP
jgi:quinoprotein dehydrogenase-associated probable ABC transporter substrate-binding protein